MADYLPPLIATLTLNATQFMAGMGEAGAVAKAETTGMGTAFNGLAAVGKVALFGTAAAVGVIGVASIKMAGDFEQATNRLVTSAGEQQANINQVRQGLLQMAGEVGNSAMDLASAMYVADSAGYTYAKGGLQVVRAAAEGAKAEGADLKVVTDAVTSAMIDYHEPASAAAQVTTTLIAAVSQGKTTFQELTGSLHSVLPISSAAHLSLAEITADVASMTVHGMSADQATQNLAHTIQHLQTTTAPQNKELALLGLNARELSNDLGTRGLAGTLQLIADRIRSDMGSSGQVILQMQTALKGLPPEVQKLGASVIDGSISMGDFTKATKDLNVQQAGLARQFATLMTSTHGVGSAQQTGSQLVQTYAAALKAATGDSTTLNTALMLTGENAGYTNTAIKNVSGATTEAGNHVAGWAAIQGTLNQHIDKWKYGLESAAIQLGTRLIPYVIQAMGAIEGLVGWLSKNQQVTIPLAAAIGGVLLVAIGAYTVSMIAAAIATIAATWPLLLVVAAAALVAAGIAVLVMHWQQLRQWVVNAAGAISGFIQHHLALALAIGILLGPIGVLIGLGALLITHWSQVVHWVQQVVGVVRHAIETHQALAAIIAVLVLGPLALMIGAAVLLVTHWRQVVSFFESLPSRIGGIFSRLGPIVHGVLAGAWNDILPVFHAGANGAVAIVSGFVSGVVHFFEWLYSHNYFFKFLVDSIKLTFEKARDDAVAIWTAIADWLGARWQWVADTATSIWDAITSFLGTKLGQARSLVVSVWSAITGWLGSIWSQIANTASLAWSNVSSVIGAKLNEAWGHVSGFIGQMADELGGLAGRAYQWAANMIGQFAQGIRDKVGQVSDAVGGVAGAVAGVLGFHSPPPMGPAADSDQWMPNFIDMLVNGLHAGAPRVASASAVLIGGLARPSGGTAGGTTANAAPSGTASGAAASGGYQITFNLYGCTDPVSTAAAIDSRLTRLLTAT